MFGRCVLMSFADCLRSFLLVEYIFLFRSSGNASDILTDTLSSVLGARYNSSGSLAAEQCFNLNCTFVELIQAEREILFIF